MQEPFKLTLRVVWWMQFILLFFALPCTIGAVLALIKIIQSSADLLVGFLLLGFFAYLGWANALSTIQITEKRVTITVFYGRFRIGWDEVEHIVMNNPFIALMGNGKRVVLSLAFARKSRSKEIEYFYRQIEQRHIKFEKNIEPFPITHQNARVWW
jgi:hypothetical protein